MRTTAAFHFKEREHMDLGVTFPLLSVHVCLITIEVYQAEIPFAESVQELGGGKIKVWEFCHAGTILDVPLPDHFVSRQRCLANKNS
jgi:hypothetical protein